MPQLESDLVLHQHPVTSIPNMEPDIEPGIETDTSTLDVGRCRVHGHRLAVAIQCRGAVTLWKETIPVLV